MTRRAGRRRGPPRCNDCGHRVVWFKSPFSSSMRTFEPTPVNPHSHTGPPAYPTEGKRAWQLREFVEELQMRRDCSYADAEDEAYAFTWHVLHQCPNDPRTTDPTPGASQ